MRSAEGREAAAIIRPQYRPTESHELPAPITIDTRMHGQEAITAAYVVHGSEGVALLETGPRSVVDNVLAGLASAGVEDLDWILVTHIHLDHAGAAGTLAQRVPSARIGVHEVGAPHLADPSKLWSSASRIYGAAMEQLWGAIDPIPEERIHVVADGDVISLGDTSLRAVETPGHAYHHHAFVKDDDGAVFTGDALGVRLPDVGAIRPATPPPEFHLEKAVASIRRLAGLDPTTLWPTHFGRHDEGESPKTPAQLCDEAIEIMERWGEWVLEARSTSKEVADVAEVVRKEAQAAAGSESDPAKVARMENTTSYWMNTWGYMRYFDKAEAATAPS